MIVNGTHFYVSVRSLAAPGQLELDILLGLHLHLHVQLYVYPTNLACPSSMSLQLFLLQMAGWDTLDEHCFTAAHTHAPR